MKKHMHYLLSLAIPVVLNVIFSSQGAFNFVSPLFCAPVIMGVFYYQKRGIWLSLVASALYVGIEMVFQPDLRLLVPMGLRVLVYIYIAILVYRLREREKRTRSELDTFLEINPDMMCVSDHGGNFIKINPAFEKVLGYGRQELEHRPFLEFVHPDDRDKTWTVHQQILGNLSVGGFVNRYRCKDGGYRYIEWSAICKGDEIYSTARDVTERKRAERMRESALKRYETVTKISASKADTEQAFLSVILCETMALTKSRQGWLFYVDEAAQSFACAAYLNTQTSDRTCAVEKPENGSVLYKVLQKRAPVVIHQPVETMGHIGTPAGREPMGNLMFIPVFTQESMTAVIGFSDEHTEYDETDGLHIFLLMKSVWEMVLRRRTERSLMQERRWFEATLLSIHDGVVATDLKGIIRTVNSNAARLTAWDAEALIGKSIKEAFLFQQKNEDKPVRIWIDVFPNHEKIRRRKDLAFLFPEGENVDLVVTASEIRVEGTACEGYLFIFQDVTQQNKDEQEIIYLTYHDKMTGLYNRRFFEEELNRLDQERMLPLSILVGDVNGLKLTNDAFGHLAGDQLLIAAADAMRSVCRREDIVARWGGDEYIILLPKTGEPAAAAMADRIRKACLQKMVGSIQLSISLGWAAKTSPGKNIADVIKQADDMMYKRKLLESRSVKSSAVRTILKALHEKSPGEEVHSVRVSIISAQLGTEMGLAASVVTDLEILGKIHDIGKISIDMSLLNKPENLTPDEYEIAKRHAETGYNIVSASPELAYLANDVLAHHERWDGTGYPNGLKEDEIPLLSRILCIADAYEAMTGERPYRRSFTKQAAIAELKRCAGAQFDPAITETFLHMIG